MKLDPEAIRGRCEALGLPLAQVLRRSGISRTAYYSLARKESVLPKSVVKLAKALDATPAEILDGRPFEERRAERRLRRAKEIVRRHPKLDFHDIWQSLVLLELPPGERLRRALRRGRARTV
ncbi:MAG TPA: helix-turn-helix transcriptional regulator [Candidatus Polarisedimenticolaceae bacterium]|nr:helix-turn-helix transcriptional regulator [Candidatus Polarisedimenticolaceae bacterium]